jgi:type II secretory pathway pseudopilin PulG
MKWTLAPCRDARCEGGYMLAVVAVFTSVLLVTLSAAVINWQKAMQREQEEELIFRGKQFMRAIDLWQRKFPGTYPTTIDALLSTNNTRFLRKKWKDPMTNAFNWRFLKMGPDGSIQGLSQAGASSYDSQSQSKSSTAGSGAQSLYGSSGSVSGYGNQGGSQGLSPSQAGRSVGGLSTQSQSGSSSSPFAPVLGGIVGVVSTSEKESIKTFNGKSKYSEWAFVYVPRGVLTGGGLPQGQNPPGQTGPGQTGGGRVGGGVVTPAPRPMFPGRSPLQ